MTYIESLVKGSCLTFFKRQLVQYNGLSKQGKKFSPTKLQEMKEMAQAKSRMHYTR